MLGFFFEFDVGILVSRTFLKNPNKHLKKLQEKFLKNFLKKHLEELPLKDFPKEKADKIPEELKKTFDEF